MLFSSGIVWSVLMLQFPLATGQYSLTGSPRPVEVGSTFTLTCTTSPVQPAIAWSETTNPSAGGSATNAYIYLPYNGKCVRSSGAPPSDYTFTCNTNGVFNLSFPASYSRHKGSIWKCGSHQGPGESTSITLVVSVPLTSVTLQNSGPLTVNQGTSVTRTCETNPTDPVSTITLRRDSQTVSQGVTSSTRTEIQGIVAISVWTKSVQWEDRGNYSCQATNNGVTETSQTIALTVQVPVSSVTLTNISTNHQEIGVRENSTLVLSCRTSPAYPAPKVTWYIKGSQTSSGVVSQTETQTNGQIITVSTITRTVGRDNDRDTSYCRAVNTNGGKQSLSARAIVYYGPDNGKLSLTRSSVIAERIPATLTCRTLTAVNPEVVFSWSYGDDTPITSGIGSKQGTARNTWSQTLTVTSVRDNNRQVVRCRVTNTETGVGMQTSLDLDVNFPPVTPTFFKAVTSTSDSVILTWVPQYVGGDHVQEFHVEYQKQSSSDGWMVKIFPDTNETIMSGVVDGLDPDTAYVFRIKSVSDRKTGNNQSQFSNEITRGTRAKESTAFSSPSSSPLGVGAGIGIGVGICVSLVSAAVATFCIVRRRKDLDNSSKDGNGRQETGAGQHHTIFPDNGPGESPSQLSDYTKLQHNPNPNTYEGIGYQNTGPNFQRNLYESLDVPSVQPHESIDTQTYVNTAKGSGDETYQNSSL